MNSAQVLLTIKDRLSVLRTGLTTHEGDAGVIYGYVPSVACACHSFNNDLRFEGLIGQCITTKNPDTILRNLLVLISTAQFKERTRGGEK